MSRQAVHKERMFAGLRHQLVVDLIRTENFNSFKEFVLLPHAGPYIGIDRVRAPHISRLRRPVDTFSRRRTVVLRDGFSKIIAIDLPWSTCSDTSFGRSSRQNDSSPWKSCRRNWLSERKSA